MKKIGLIKALALTKKADKMNDNERVALQQKRLKELISYAKENSPYFAKLYADIDENAPLSALPVTNKKEMMMWSCLLPFMESKGQNLRTQWMSLWNMLVFWREGRNMQRTSLAV